MLFRNQVAILFTLVCLGYGFGKEVKKKAKPNLNSKNTISDEMVLDFDSKPMKKADGDTSKFEELQIEKSFVIEAKVERPQVQFPLLKEAPPEKPISFEASFRDELLAAPRENTFKLE